MSYWFFFSYARGDTDPYLERFFRELSAEVRRLVGSPSTSVGFRDTQSIKTGGDWPEELKVALQTSRVLVCLTSPTYFYSEFCGKEFQVFRDRLKMYTDANPGAPPPRTILPVSWVPERGKAPDSVSSLQRYDDDFPREYREEGLRYLMQLTRFSDQYNEFVVRFAQRVVDVATAVALPPLPYLPDLGEVQNPFRSPSDLAAGEAVELSAGGPENVRFVFVAARKREMQGVRNNVNYYDDAGGWHWSPYNQVEKNKVGAMAQRISGEEQFQYAEIGLTQGIIRQIEEAARKNEIVIIIVDAWTIKIQHYWQIVKPFQDRFLHCAVIVPWNGEDEETRSNRPTLEASLHVIFRFQAELSHKVYFQTSIHSAEELMEGMRSALTEIKMKIIEYGETVRKIEGELITKPIISVPTGDTSR